MRSALLIGRRWVLGAIVGLPLVAAGCGSGENSILPTPTKTAPPASEWKGLYNGTGTDPATDPSKDPTVGRSR